MFKSKVAFDAFDKKNQKVKDLDLSQAKNLSKTAIKKLSNAPETPTI